MGDRYSDAMLGVIGALIQFGIHRPTTTLDDIQEILAGRVNPRWQPIIARLPRSAQDVLNNINDQNEQTITAI